MSDEIISIRQAFEDRRPQRLLLGEARLLFREIDAYKKFVQAVEKIMPRVGDSVVYMRLDDALAELYRVVDRNYHNCPPPSPHTRGPA
jgi:hypothetical protein